MVVLRNGCAFVRGLILKIFAACTGRKRIKIGKKLRVFSGGQLRWRGNGSMTLGKSLKMDQDALLATVGGCLEIGDHVGIGVRNMIVCHEKISIGDNTILAPNVMIYDHDHVFDSEHGVRVREYKKQEVIIGKNCWIGAGTVILRGTRIGDNCVVGAGCVLKGQYESGSCIIQKRETSVITQ